MAIPRITPPRAPPAVRRDLEPPDSRPDARPFLRKEALARAASEPCRRACSHEHADSASHADEAVLLEALIGFRYCERVRALLGGEGAHGRKRIAVPVAAVENRIGDVVAQAQIDGALAHQA
jgi:hypothetical protein